MAQFDVHRNPAGHDDAAIPYLLDVQSDLLDDLATRVVVPLVRADALRRHIARLNPVFDVEDVRVVMATPPLAAIATADLGEQVGNPTAERDRIIAALDVLFTGV